jgi:hypothetical protein
MNNQLDPQQFFRGRRFGLWNGRYYIYRVQKNESLVDIARYFKEPPSAIPQLVAQNRSLPMVTRGGFHVPSIKEGDILRIPTSWVTKKPASSTASLGDLQAEADAAQAEADAADSKRDAVSERADLLCGMDPLGAVCIAARIEAVAASEESVTKGDAAAAAQRQADADAEAQRQADAAAAAQRQADADAEAQRQADAAAAAQRQADADAEAQRQADADAEAQRQADADAEAQRQAEEARSAQSSESSRSSGGESGRAVATSSGTPVASDRLASKSASPSKEVGGSGMWMYAGFAVLFAGLAGGAYYLTKQK